MLQKRDVRNSWPNRSLMTWALSNLAGEENCTRVCSSRPTGNKNIMSQDVYVCVDVYINTCMHVCTYIRECKPESFLETRVSDVGASKNSASLRYFRITSEIRDHFTRNCLNYREEFGHTVVRKFSIVVTVPSVLNFRAHRLIPYPHCQDRGTQKSIQFTSLV